MKNKKRETVVLLRDTKAVMVPSGARIMLHKGTEVTIFQAVGGFFTVYVFGNFARIDGVDSDALNKELESPLKNIPEKSSVKEKVMMILDKVYDPEISISIIELGLVYECDVSTLQDGKNLVRIKMTLTSPTCGMGDVIVSDAINKIKLLKEVSDVKIELLFSPPWSSEMMSEAARLERGMM